MSKIFIILLFISSITFEQTEKKYSVDELISDIAFLKLKLQSNHPNLYLYTNKQILNKAFDSLTNSIKVPMSELEFYNHIAIICSIIKDGHTMILPSNNLISYHNASSNFLPYKFKLLNNSLFVEMVLTSNTTISEKAEIIKINSIDTKTILHQLAERQVRDGYNETYPNWIIDSYFREYYSFIFGHPLQFLIEYKVSNIIETATVSATSKDSINYFKQLKYPNKTGLKLQNEGIVYRENPNENFATLTIKDFHKSELKKKYKQDFKTSIQNAFQRLNNSKIQNLIIDLRNNQGGDIEYSVYLLSYLLQDTFRVVEQYYRVSNAFNYQLVKTNGKELGWHQPNLINFKGQLYVLINGGSFSNSGIVTAVLKQHNRAQFVGTETGGNNKVLAGYIDEFTLPNTKIRINIPTKQFMLNETLPLTGHGTKPDFEINETIDDILANRDTQKEYVIKLINDKKR